MRGSRRLATGQQWESWGMQKTTLQTLCDLANSQRVRHC